MTGQEIASVLLRASVWEIDDAADALARDVRGCEIVDQFKHRVRLYQEGPPPPHPWSNTSTKLKRRTKA